MKRFLSIFLIFLFIFAPVNVSAASKFKDVPSSYWAASHITEASDLGIIYGYSNGTFVPKKNVNKQEAFIMIFRIMKIAGLAQVSGYIPVEAPLNNDALEDGATSDEAVSEQAAVEEYVEFVADVNPDSEQGQIILDQYLETWKEVLDVCGFSDNIGMRRAAAFGLQYGICEAADFAEGAKTDASRELIAKWSCSALQYELAPVAVLSYKDADSVSPECIPAVDALYRHGIMLGGSDGNFKPKAGIIRAEIAAIAVRMLKDVQAEYILTVANTLVNIYGEVTSVNNDTGVITIKSFDGERRLLINSDAQIYYDGNAAEFWDLDLVGKTLSISALNGGNQSVCSAYISSVPAVQKGTVIGNIQQLADFYMVTILQSGGVSNTFVFTDKTLGRIPVSGTAITFISDGLELLEVK